MALKLGRQKRGFDFSVPQYFGLRMMAAQSYTLPALSRVFDNASKLPQDLGMMLNDTLGCCTCAAMGHAMQLTSFDTSGYMTTPTDADVENAYEAFGYVPGNPSTDQGAVIQQVLAWWKNDGMWLPNLVRNKILGYAEIDVRQPLDICEAIQEGGYAYIGFEVPSGFMDDVESNGTTVWDANPNYGAIEGGHCVILTGFNLTDQNNPTYNLISWGSRQWTMTTAFMNKYVDEVYMVIDPMWIESSGKSPLGLTEDQIQQVMQHI